MKQLLLGLLIIATSAGATETGKCDAKPFTLKKPAVTPAPPPPKTAAPPAAATPKATPAPRAKIVIGCKQPATKS
jgi:hypothetical protein